jgi:hypothetical protein
MKSNEPDFFEIDKNQLDREWVRQPGLYHKYALQLADAKRDFEQAKTAVDLAEASADSDIRERPQKYGIEKVTEAAVKATVAGHKAVKEAIAALHEARHKVDVLQAAVTTLDHRKKALENLVDLRLADYFAEPRAGRATTTDINERTKRAARRAVEDNGDE